MTTQAAPSSLGREILVLADGVELVGEYEDSGYREPPLLARRADGQMIQLSRLLYLVAAACDGRRDAHAVAERVTDHYGRRRVSARNVQHVAERKLRPLGVLALRDGTTPQLPKRAPVMALRHRRPLVGERAVNVLAAGFTWLHRPLVRSVLLLALAALDIWLFFLHGVAGGVRAVLYHPTLLLGVLASIVVATAFHEVGHASACRYSGARPGAMGVGIYLVWPAFYCDVTDAYRLNRVGRLRTDLGGVYFNGIFSLLAGAAYLVTGQEALLLVVVVQHSIMLQQLLPLLRFDGYYVLSDLTGVPDILSRIKPIFRSLLPGRSPEPQVDALKPWVRVIVTAYLLVLIPTLAFMVVSTLLAAPRMVATGYDSLGLQLDRIRSAHAAPQVALGGIQVGALLMPLGAMAVSLGRSGRMAARGMLSWSAGSIGRRAVAALATAAVAGGAGYTWWPNGDYQPIRPGERGTIPEAAAGLSGVPSGRPSFTRAREQEFGPVPTVRQQAATARPSGPRTAAGRTGRHKGLPESTPRSTPEANPRARTEPAEDEAPGTAGDQGTPQDPGTSAPAQPGTAGTATPAPSTQPAVTATPTASADPSASPQATLTPEAAPTETATATPTSAAPTASPSSDTTGAATPTASPAATP